MFKRPSTWFVISLLCLAGAWYFWKLGDQWAAQKRSAPPFVPKIVAPASSVPVTKIVSAATALLPRLTPGLLAAQAQAQATPVNPLAYRLSNTTRPLQELLRRDHALLLENALIDTETPVSFAIPPHLRGPADPGSYLVQARGPIDENFRSRLRAAGATVVAYIPNNAYLVRASTTGAARLAAFAETQVILPYEPYYKLEPELLRAAVDLEPLPDDAGLNLVLFADAAEATKAELAALGLEILAEERSPFGPVVQVSRPAQDWYAVATLPGVQTVELLRKREAANDLTRVRLAVSSVPQATTNWLGLTGSNILVNVNDSWEYIAAALPEHPDLTNRVIYGTPYSLVDSNGHATHVAGTIAGSGAVSTTVTNVFGSLNPGVTGQYRGMAPGASIFALPVNLGSRPFQNFGGPVSDTYLQETAAGTNAFISNNSWHYASAARYNLAAASYDAAVRDALPGVTGSQPLVYVFAAGNVGGGGDDGLGGRPDRVQSPGTAKNVISVGALELPRDITNEVWKCSLINLDTNGQPICTTNSPWRDMTSEATEVAGFSSRGNTGLGVEGDFGRFKPDVVAPGTFVVSARSQYWNEAEYYNPTNYTTTTLASETVAGANTNFYSVFVPENAVGLNLTVLSSRFLRIQVWKGKNPNDPVDFTKLDNQVTAPPDGGTNFGPVNTTWWYSVDNNTNATQTNTYALIRTLITTNDLGNYYEVYSNLNNSISGSTPHYYRYESGSSMAAAAVSGSLALMQEFFERRLQRTNSPALMKALLINGARSAGPLYFSEVRNSINYQGWGLARVRNSLPSSLTNFVAGAPSSMWLVDQSPTNALTTGQSRTHTITVNNNAARNQPLRVTLVWTDPPGSPAAGVKLVNDLDLIVTNTDTKEVFFGNQIEAGSNFSTPWDTNNPALGDVVNNVENVYLFPPLDTNFTVTVRARHVNVNAVTAQTNNVVQDYALVISSGDGQVSGALTVNPAPGFLAAPEARITYVTNTFSQADPLTGQPTAAGFLLDYQRVGANTPLLGTTNGMTNQWHFYVVTNTTTFTNAAFVTFIPTELAIPRIGVREALLNNATRIESDIDLYVSTDFNLTNLSPVAVAGARQSRGRGGTEQIILGNAVPNQIYYIGVKAEDQMAAEYSFFGVFSELPFGDEEGNVPCFNVPQVIPDRSPDNVQGQRNVARVLCPCVLEGETRRVVVTNSFTHEHFEDLVGNVAHGQRFAVLNNHRFPPPAPVPPGPYHFIYEDNGEGDIVSGANQQLLISDGPGSLRDFVGEPRVGPWIFTFLDDAWTQTGQVDQVGLKVEATSGTNVVVIPPNSWRYEVVNVGIGATNLTICVAGNTAGVELYVRKNGFPTLTAYDQFLGVSPPGDCLQITLSDLPPLSPGRYFIGVFNPSASVQTVRITATVDYDLNGVIPINWDGGGNEYLLDDAVTTNSIVVPNRSRIAAVDVGVRIDHPRVSDLALTLISPRGTRVLLFENRGMTNTLGIGSSIYVTNVIPVATNGGAAAVTKIIDTGRTSGTLTVDYNFLCAPDQMTIYYEGKRITNTGFINNGCPAAQSVPARFTFSYGPGASTEVTFIMNEFGPFDTNLTTWSYTVSDVGANHSYLTFTENTNRTTTPIKFLAPPFLPPLLAPPALIGTGFEAAAAGDYVAFTNVDGWSALRTNPVTVLNDLTLAHTGTKSLALRAGEIRRTLPTLVGGNYQLKFAYRTAPVLDGPVSWWLGQNNAMDFVDGNNGTLLNGVTFGAGRVGQAFNFDGVNDHIVVPDAPNLRFTNALTLEAWIYPRSYAGFSRGIIQKWGGTLNQRSYTFDINPAGKGYIGVSSDGGFGNVIYVESVSTIPRNQWTHIAANYDGSTLKYYVNGQLDNTGVWTQGIFLGRERLIIGAAFNTSGMPTSFFNGLIDEPAVFNRTLTDDDIRDIYAAGAAGKCGMVKAPTVCVPSGAQVFIPGVITNSFLGTTNWQTNTVFFTATANGTPVHLAPVSGPSGVLLDTFTLGESASSLYALPEESLRALDGESAFGTWELEIWDSRTGETNKVSLLSWQLSFVFQNEFALPEPLQPGVPQTNSVPPGRIAYHVVDVPAWARFATNTLIFADGPVDVWFNQNTPPVGTNAGDFLLIGPGSTGGSRTLALASAPPLLPGRRYYLGVRNRGPATVTYALMVEFDITPLFNRVPVSDTIAVGALPRYFYYDVSSNATAVSYQLLNLSGNADLVARQGAPPPTLTDFDYGSFNSGANDEAIVVFTNSTPVALRPGRWYLGVFNTGLVPADYTILATEYTNVFSAIITLTNGIAYHATNPGPANALDYYRYRVTTNAVRARFEITNASGDLTLLARKGLPLPNLATFDYQSTNAFPNDEFIVVLNTSSPVPLTAGDWFLAAVNVSGAPVTYSIKATEWPATGQPIIITNSVVVSNAFCLTWTSRPGAQYYVQGLTSLNSTNWVTRSPTITATDFFTTWCEPLPSPFHFFRVIEGLSTNATPVITSITHRNNTIVLEWTGPVSATYEVQWSPVLVPPGWTSFTNRVTSTNGQFRFVDNSTQTGGFGATRFYRLQQLP